MQGENIKDLQKQDVENRDYLQLQLNKLYMHGLNFCMHQCKLRDYEAEMQWCQDYCHRNYEIPRKVAMHVGQDMGEQLFRKCLAEYDEEEIDLKRVMDCTHQMHKGKMFVAEDHINRVLDLVKHRFI